MSIQLPWPAKELSPNARLHWARKAKATKAARTTAYWLTEAAHATVPEAGPVVVDIEFIPPDRRRRDLDGMFASCKAYLDGIADALKVNDHRFVFRLARSEPAKPGKVVVSLPQETRA